jgi:signal transduction histidine kinase
LPSERLALQKWAGFEAGAVAPALLVAAGYYVASRLGFLFTLQPHPISVLWAANSLLMAALLLAAPRTWWMFVAAALPAHLLAQLQSGVPVAMVLGWFASNCSEALVGAGLVRALVGRPLRLDSFRNAIVFVLMCAVTAPLLSSFLDAALVRLVGWGEGGYWELVRLRFFSNVLAVLMIVPLILAWAELGWPRPRAAPRGRIAEVMAVIGGLLLTSAVIFGMGEIERSYAPALYYAPLPFLLWAAVRLGTAATASALFVTTLLTIWSAVGGYGPFAAFPPDEAARTMQMFLIALSVPLLLLAVALEERERTAREAQEQRLQLTHLSRVAMLGEMSGGLAHELNQPLTAILSNAQAAQHFIAKHKAIDPEELSEILRDIIAADQRAGEVILRLRSLFKRGETHFQRLDVNELVRETLGLAHGDLATRGIEASTQLAQALPPVQADRIQLQQVMLNLIMNAGEAMAAGAGAERRLTIRTGAVDYGVQISFVDGGPGFPAEAYDKLFEPFYTTKPQGLGLGLSISRSIVLAHGGRLWGTSQPGRGASFHIALPAERA